MTKTMQSRISLTIDLLIILVYHNNVGITTNVTMLYHYIDLAAAIYFPIHNNSTFGYIVRSYVIYIK